MGQKVHPTAYRLGPLYTWKSRWYADAKTYQHNALEDLKVREYLMDKLKNAGCHPSGNRPLPVKKIKIRIFVSRPAWLSVEAAPILKSLKSVVHQLFKDIIPKIPMPQNSNLTILLK